MYKCAVRLHYIMKRTEYFVLLCSVITEEYNSMVNHKELERGHPIVYYQICIIYYATSIHNIHQTRCNNYN